MQLYIIRHGETDWNKARRIQGRADIPLNEFGRSLARKTREGLLSVPFYKAYTSPLIRARETAQLVLRDRDVDIVEDKRLMEIGFGEYEGLCCDPKNWNIPNREFQNFFLHPDHYVPPKGGESFTQVRDRIVSFFEDLYGSLDDKEATVLIATHGATLCTILNWLKGEPLEKLWGKGVHKNCEVTIVDYHPGNTHIINEGIVYYDDDVKIW